jgi:small subunit ribosomal protein S18
MKTQKKRYRRLKFRVWPARKPTEEELSYCKKLLAFGVLSWQDTHLLVHFLSDQCKILPRRATGLSSKDHKTVTKLIKMARVSALLPFTHPKGVPLTIDGTTYPNPSTIRRRPRRRG